MKEKCQQRGEEEERQGLVWAQSIKKLKKQVSSEQPGELPHYSEEQSGEEWFKSQGKWAGREWVDGWQVCQVTIARPRPCREAIHPYTHTTHKGKTGGGRPGNYNVSCSNLSMNFHCMSMTHIHTFSHVVRVCVYVCVYIYVYICLCIYMTVSSFVGVKFYPNPIGGSVCVVTPHPP